MKIFPLVLFCLFLLIFSFISLRYRFRQILVTSIILPILIVLTGSLVFQNTDKNLPQPIKQKIDNVLVTGIIAKISPGNNYSSVIIGAVTIITKSNGQKKLNGDIRCNIYDSGKKLSASPGDTLYIRTDILPVKKSTNPGEYDRRESYRRKNIVGRININSVDSIIVTGNNNFFNPHKILWGVRKDLMDKSVRLFGKGSIYNALADALILGERNNIDDSTEELFRNGGIIHLLAVSGLHTGYIILIFYLLAARGGLKLRLLFSIIGIILFILISGGSVSVIRAGIMAIVFMIAILTGRDRNGFNSLAAAFLFILLVNPYELFEAGFQLSFIAVTGILISIRFLNRYYEKKLITGFKRKTITFLTVNLSAWIFTLPIVLFHFGGFTYSGLLNNIVAIPLTGIILFAIILTIFTSYLSITIAVFVASGAMFFIDILMSFITISNRFFGEIIYLPITIYWIFVFFILLFFSIYIISRRKSKIKKVTIVVLVIFTFLVWEKDLRKEYIDRSLFNIIMIDVGQGDAYLILTPENEAILIDAGNYLYPDRGKYVITPLLNKLGIDKLDYLFVSHLDADHAGGTISVTDNIRTDKMYIPDNSPDNYKYNKFISHFEKYFEDLYIYNPKIIKLTNSRIYILRDSLQNNYRFISENDRSGVFKFCYGDFEVLFTGDAGLLVEEKLISKYSDFLRSDILKVSHHGSKFGTSAEFVGVVKPQAALISAGLNNRYGHPADNVLRNLSDFNVQIFRTDHDGYCILTSDGISFSRYIWN